MKLNDLRPVAKAVAGGVAAGLAALAVALDGGVTAAEWVAVAVATLGGTGLVYTVPNKPAA